MAVDHVSWSRFTHELVWSGLPVYQSRDSKSYHRDTLLTAPGSWTGFLELSGILRVLQIHSNNHFETFKLTKLMSIGIIIGLLE